MKLGPVLLILLAPVLTFCEELDLERGPVDCKDIHEQDKTLKSGVYTILPRQGASAVQVYCDMETSGGGWTVIQRRMDGSVTFYRSYRDYRVGFGNVSGEYWLGLDNMHDLTEGRRYELLVEMEDFHGEKVSARYTTFSVDDQCNGYMLEVGGFHDGGAGDSLTYHSGSKFTTFDKDQDGWSSGNCAKRYLGPFWHNNCHWANPNGVYRWGADSSTDSVGVDWYHWKGYNYSLKNFSMKIRPVV